MVRTKQLSNGWEMAWIPHATDPKKAHAVSGKKGRCRIHRSGENEWTAYLINPYFVPVGIFGDHKEAIEEAEYYDRKNEKAKKR
jgi:hypothetical protein